MSDYFSESDLERIEKAVSDAEKNTSGEIKVVIRMDFDKEFSGDIDRQALHDFDAHGLANTRDKTGVLVLMVLSAKQFKILADKGIYEKAGKWYFEEIALAAGIMFMTGRFADGLVEAVAEIGRKLAFHFPRKSDDTDELPNKPVFEESN